MLEKYLDIKPEVKKALDEGKPVVALESTIISHGMPYPKNVEQILRDKGVMPATIAILDGRLKVGVTDEELERLGQNNNVIKTSRRDMPFIVAKKLDGATTVATTMIIAALAGIKIFATGGIGGAHRGAQETFDISADLEELAHTNVAVVCAGAKSILDLGLTLEYLETNGVPVVGFGTNELPAFYTRKSGFGVDYRIDSAKEVADAIKAKWDLGLNGGMVIANKAINEAVKEAEEKGIRGKESTPFLLAKIKDITGGNSLESNIKLVYNNAKLAADIAIELCK